MGLKTLFDKAAPLFKEGGKLSKLYPLYEGALTFTYQLGDVTKPTTKTHVRDSADFKRIIIMVFLAALLSSSGDCGMSETTPSARTSRERSQSPTTGSSGLPSSSGLTSSTAG